MVVKMMMVRMVGDVVSQWQGEGGMRPALPRETVFAAKFGALQAGQSARVPASRGVRSKSLSACPPRLLGARGARCRAVRGARS
eukprot:6196490-Pleurochrysis_carterae.AAC.3